MLPEDGPIGPKHVGAKEIFYLYVLTFYVFNKRVHLLVEGILMLSKMHGTTIKISTALQIWMKHELFCAAWRLYY